MSKRLSVLALSLLLGFVPLTAAQRIQIQVFGKHQYSQDVVKQDAFNLQWSSNAGLRMPSQWTIVLLSPGDWQDYVKKYEADTNTAFTLLGQNLTYINEEYVMTASGERVRHTLAHEAGHMICNCLSERTANELAKQLESK